MYTAVAAECSDSERGWHVRQSFGTERSVFDRRGLKTLAESNAAPAAQQDAAQSPSGHTAETKRDLAGIDKQIA